MALEQVIEPYMFGAAHLGRINELAEAHTAAFLECIQSVPSWSGSLSNDLDRVQNDLRADQRRVGPDCIPSHNRHIHADREVPHDAEDYGVAPRRNATKMVPTLCIGESSMLRSVQKDLNTREGAAAGICTNDTGNRALGGGLRYQAARERHDAKKSKRGSK